MSLAVLCSVVCAVAVLAILVTTRGGDRRSEWVFKPVAATAFVAAGLAWGGADSRFGLALVIGLGLSWWGDVLLIPKDRRAFLAGLVAFLLGHLAYATAFALRGVEPAWVAGGALAAGAVAVPVLRWLLPHVEPPMKAPVLAYVTVISAMVALSLGTVAAHGNPWIAVGAIAFFASDLAVARDQFVRREWWNKLWGLPLYFGAQLVLAWCAGAP
jgi:uncharacterized membrane protein YhhN